MFASYNSSFILELALCQVEEQLLMTNYYLLE